MRTLILIRRVVFGTVVAVAAAQIPAQAAVERQTRDEIVYITGGVGIDERELLKQMENEFNLKLLFAQSDRALVSDVAVVVKNASGRPVLTEQASPIIMVKLPPGTYVVETAFEGKKQTRKVVVGKQLTTVLFRWPGSSAAPMR